MRQKGAFRTALIAAAVSVVAINAVSAAVVILVDLTKSTPEEMHQKNIGAITEIVRKTGPGKIVIIGITDSSFAKPQEILNFTLPVGSPPNETNFLGARAELFEKWKGKAAGLIPDKLYSDVLGAISYASLILQEEADGDKTLLIFSDVRHNTKVLDIETVPEVKVEPSLQRVKLFGLIPNLKGVRVWVLGVHTTGKEPRYYTSLGRFWREFFKHTGSDLVEFGPGRNFNFLTAQ